MTDAGTDPRIAVALAALAEITDPSDVGDLVDASEIAPGVVDLHFSATMPGYVAWRWTVSTAVVEEGDDPTVLEVQLLPGEGSLLAPPWVPWTERLAEWRRSHPDEDVDADEDDAEDGDDDESDDLVDADDADDGDSDDALDEDPLEAAGVEAEDVVADDDESDDDVDGADDLTDDDDLVFGPRDGGGRS